MRRGGSAGGGDRGCGAKFFRRHGVDMSENVLREKLKLLPDSPGVYIMLDRDGVVIYVGKARVLKNRVRQYFRSSS